MKNKEETSLLRKAWVVIFIVSIVASIFCVGLYLLDKKCQNSNECIGSEEENIHNITNYLLNDAKYKIPLGIMMGLILFGLDWYLTSHNSSEVKK